MGRHRTFDLDKATAIAADLFWRQGYEGTSINDLTKAIGVAAPSFYFAFGSKEGLLRRIVESYLAQQGAIVEVAFAAPDTRTLVDSLLRGFAAFFADPNHAPGCLVLNNALPIDDAHPFRAEWAEGRNALRESLEQRFADDLAGERGFPAAWMPHAAARMVYTLVWGIAIEVHSGAKIEQIERMIDQFMVVWPMRSAA